MTVVANNSFNDLPFDIFFDIIVPNIHTKDVLKISCLSKKYNSNLEQMLKTVLENDIFFNNYMKNRTYDILQVVNNSSFSPESFFKMYDNINYDSQPSFIMEFHDLTQNKEDYHYHQNTIDNTCELFRILMNLAMYRLKFQFRNFVTNGLIEYCSHVYKLKYPNRNDVAYDKFSILILQKDDLLWFTSNINIYTIYENYNLFSVARRSFDLKNNLEQNVCNIELNVFENDKTVEFIMTLFQHIGNCEFEIYLLHTILSYLNTVFCTDKINNSCYKVLLEKETFKTVIIHKTIYIQDVILDYTDVIPYNIRKIITQNAINLYDLLTE